MSSESEFLNPTFKVGVCYNENKINFSCLDCADLWECTLQRAIETNNNYKNPFEKLEIYMDTFKVPLFRKIKSYYNFKIKPRLEKIKQYAFSVKREIKGAISFFERLSSQFKNIFRDNLCFYSVIKRSLPYYLNYYRSIDSNCSNVIKIKIKNKEVE